VSPTPEAASFYDAMWDRYAHLDAASPAAFHRRRLISELAARYAPDARDLLDVGCGQGELLGDLARRLPNARLSGADVSERSLEATRRRDPRIDTFSIDLMASDFAETHRERLGRFDLIACSEVLEHVPDDDLAAERLGTLLAPGGHFVVTVPGGKKSRFDLAIGHLRHYDRETLRALLAGAGFEVLRVMAWGFPFHNLYRSAVRIAARVAIRDGAAAEPSDGGGSVVSNVLGRAYGLFGRVMKPLYYLNQPRWGEQMLAVVRRAR